LALSSLVTVETAFAQSISPPSIPDFTVEFIDSSYDVSATYSVDEYTGRTLPMWVTMWKTKPYN
jgi:hypothetical protein